MTEPTTPTPLTDMATQLLDARRNPPPEPPGSPLPPEVGGPDLVWAKSKDGEVVRIPRAMAQDAATAGYSDPTDAEIHDRQLQDVHGHGLANEAAAAAESLARTVTFGASDAVERGLGVDPEGIAAREKFNPVGATLGTVAGLTVPLAGEAGLLGKGVETAAKFTAPSLIGRAGRAVAAGVADALPEAAPGVAGIIARQLPRAAGSSIEGMLYSGQPIVSEAALGDPNLNAQKAVSSLGLGAILGGSFGATLGAGEELLSPALKAAREATAKVRDTVVNHFPQFSALVSGGEHTAEDAAAAIASRSQLLKTPAEATRDLVSGLNSQAKATEAALADHLADADVSAVAADADPGLAQQTVAKVRAKLEEVRQVMDAAPEHYPPSYSEKLARISADLGSGAAQNEAASDILNPGTGAAQDTPRVLFEKLTRANADVQRLALPGEIPGEHMDAQAAVRVLGKAFNDATEDGAVWGPAVERAAALNNDIAKYRLAEQSVRDSLGRELQGGKWAFDADKVKAAIATADSASGKALKAYQEATGKLLDTVGARAAQDSVNENSGRAAIEELRSRLSDKAEEEGGGSGLLSGVLGGGLVGHLASEGLEGAGHLLGPLAGVAGAYKAGKFLWKMGNNPVEAAMTLAKLERAANGVGNKIDAAVKALVAHDASTEKSAAIGLSARLLQSRDHEDTRARYERVTDALTELQEPDKLHAHVENSIAGLMSHAPQTAQAAATTQARAISFLQSKVPQHPSAALVKTKWRPSSQEIDTFNRYLNAVDRPLDIINQARAGTLTAEAIEAVHTVYPDLYHSIAGALTQELTDAVAKGKTISFRAAQGMSAILGKPVLDSLSPSEMQRSAAVWARVAGNAPNTAKAKGSPTRNRPRTTQGGLSHLDMSSRAASEIGGLKGKGED